MSFELTQEEGEFIVKFARKAITHYLKTKEKISIPEDISPSLKKKAGVFVTLNKLVGRGKSLRGCIGFPEPILPLIEAVRDSAIESATGDPRFPPVVLDELKDIVIEVSILTPPELIKVSDPLEYPSKIEVGRDGLIVESGWRRGLLLPQVPVEWGWDSEEFLNNCCLKAGLVPEAWVLPETRVYKFQALIFEEESPGGSVRQKKLK